MESANQALAPAPARSKQSSTKIDTPPVLVIGGSVVGLSAALFLALKGVKTILVERHRGSSPHPRAIGYTPRTMELFALAGIIDQIPQVPAGFRLSRVDVESLAGHWQPFTEWTPTNKDQPATTPIEYSPYNGAAIAQDKLEPILRSRAAQLGADLRYSTELISFEQDAEGVTARVRERDGDNEYTIQAQYMIAADGNHSPVREKLGIHRQGPGLLNTVRSVLFRAPLEEYLKSGIHQFEINQPDLKAFLTTYNDGRWVLMFTDDIERNEVEQREAIIKAIGRTDIPVEIITTGRWELTALIAETFAVNRVFITGDSAHTLPPTRGGFGANTGIQDAHNLAWKLSAVLSGVSTPQLLDTYSAERQPVAWVRYLQTFARPDYAAYATEEAKKQTIIDDAAMEFGQLYRSTAVLGAGDDLPSARKPDEWAGQPGTRAPHQWLTKNGERLSTIDLFGRGWVLLTENPDWCPAAKSAGQQLGVRLDCLCVGPDGVPDDAEAFRTAFGLTPAGASLIRPDGYVAWRTTDLPTDPFHTLTDSLGQVLSAPADRVARH